MERRGDDLVREVVGLGVHHWIDPDAKGAAAHGQMRDDVVAALEHVPASGLRCGLDLLYKSRDDVVVERECGRTVLLDGMTQGKGGRRGREILIEPPDGLAGSRQMVWRA